MVPQTAAAAASDPPGCYEDAPPVDGTTATRSGGVIDTVAVIDTSPLLQLVRRRTANHHGTLSNGILLLRGGVVDENSAHPSRWILRPDEKEEVDNDGHYSKPFPHRRSNRSGDDLNCHRTRGESGYQYHPSPWKQDTS
jgi:hypothetical protein